MSYAFSHMQALDNIYKIIHVYIFDIVAEI